MRGKEGHPECHLLASGVAALVNYPLWKASAINQSGFVVQKEKSVRNSVRNFVVALSPPYRSVPWVLGGMTWARAMIFYGSDKYRRELDARGAPRAVSTALPPLLLSSLVQIVNMPVVRASITMQNPATYNDPKFRSTVSTLRHLAETKGFLQLWHGLSAGLAKSVPKYITSVVVKDAMEAALPPAHSDQEFLMRSSVKSVCAGVAGAVLTNPMDVVRNEMFKRDTSFVATVRNLSALEKDNRRPPLAWAARGLGSNLIAVSLPITLTIFLTDFFVRFKEGAGAGANAGADAGDRATARRRSSLGERKAALLDQDQQHDSSAFAVLQSRSRTTPH